MDIRSPSANGEVPTQLAAADASSAGCDEFNAQRGRRRDEVRRAAHQFASKLALHGRALADPALIDLAELLSWAVNCSRKDPRFLSAMARRARARAGHPLVSARAGERPQTRCDAACQLAAFMRARSIDQFKRAADELRRRANEFERAGRSDLSRDELERAERVADQAARYEAEAPQHYALDFVAELSLTPILADATPMVAPLVQHVPGSASQPTEAFSRAWAACVAAVARAFEDERFEHITDLAAERIVTRGLAALGCETKNLFGRR